MKRRRICSQRRWSLWKRFRKFGFRVVLCPIFASFFMTSGGFAKNKTVEPVQLASFSGLTPLSDASMAVVTGRGLQLPSFAATAQSRGAVVLWDEVRPSNLPQRFDNSGSDTITVNGTVQ